MFHQVPAPNILIRLICGAALVAGLPGSVKSPPSAFAATLTVTKTDDTNDGVCDSDCSLREAIVAANASPDSDTILLPGGNYILTVPGTDDDAATSGDLDITSNVTIYGAGADSTIIDGNGSVLADRVLQVIGSITVSIYDLTVQGGKVASIGAGVLSQGYLTMTNSAVFDNHVTSDVHGGGGIYNLGTLTLINSTVVSNSAAVFFSFGGGIANYGVLQVINSTIISNTSSVGGGGIADGGGVAEIIDTTISGNYGGIGGISNSGTLTMTNSTVSGNIGSVGGIYNDGSMTLSNSTISGNSALQEGGIFNYIGGALYLNNVTITNNVADSDNDGSGDGGGILNIEGVVNFQNTIIGGNFDLGGESPDCSGTLTSQGYNLIQTTVGCVISGTITGNLIGVDPALEALRDNGGSSLTHALLFNSPAIDAGDPASCTDNLNFPLSTDQRGFVRPVDGDANGSFVCDMGAYEFGAVPAIQFVSNAFSANEESNIVTITVVSAAPVLTATVNYATSDGTALGGSDYLTSTGILTFAPGVTIQTFDVLIIDDTFQETAETITLTLSSPINAALGVNDQAVLTILGDVFELYLPLIMR